MLTRPFRRPSSTGCGALPFALSAPLPPATQFGVSCFASNSTTAWVQPCAAVAAWVQPCAAVADEAFLWSGAKLARSDGAGCVGPSLVLVDCGSAPNVDWASGGTLMISGACASTSTGSLASAACDGGGAADPYQCVRPPFWSPDAQCIARLTSRVNAQVVAARVPAVPAAATEVRAV